MNTVHSLLFQQKKAVYSVHMRFPPEKKIIKQWPVSPSENSRERYNSIEHLRKLSVFGRFQK